MLSFYLFVFLSILTNKKEKNEVFKKVVSNGCLNITARVEICLKISLWDVSVSGAQGTEDSA